MTSPSITGTSRADVKIKPLWTVKLEEEESFLDWFKDVTESLQDSHRERTQRDLVNRDFYMGLQSMALGREGIPRDKEGKPLEKFARVTVNQCYELIEQWVSKTSRFAPAIAVIPPNNENNDRMAARLSKDFIDYIFYQNDIDDVLEEVARSCRIDGETYALVRFNRDIGDYHPDQVEAESLNIRIPLLDSQGNQVLGEDGDPLFIEKKARVGDVEFSCVQRRFILVQPKTKWKDVEWFVHISCADIDELIAEFPDRADDLSAKTSGNQFDLDMFEADREWNEILVFELFHKSHKFLDSGRYIKFTQNVVLKNTSLEEEVGHTELPIVRLTNVDVPGMLHGYSFLEQLKLLQVMYNNLASIAYTNIALGAHLYWLVPAQANVDIGKLRNSSSVIKYNAGMAPQIAQFKTVGAEIFEMMKMVNEFMQVLSGIQGVSRGEVPPGIEAGVALAFLEEQENQRANTDIKKHNAFIKKLARLSLATAGAFYKAEDGRTIRIVGKNNQFSIKALDVAKLGGPYDIRVQRTTALSESKSGRLSQILALEGRFPGKLPWEQVADMLDLANDQKYYDLATVAVQASDRENEQMAEGVRIQAPKNYEELLVHWYGHVKYMNSSAYKEDMPPERKVIFEEHIMATEFLMLEKMKVNPTFQMKVLALENFPVFSVIEPVTAPPVPENQSSNGSIPAGQEGPPSPMPSGGEPEPTEGGEGPMPGMEALPPNPPSPEDQPEAMPN